MLKAFWTNDATAYVDEQIEAVAEQMIKVGVMHDKYPDLVKRMAELTEIKAKANRKIPVSRDTLVMGGVFLVQTLVVVFAEHERVINSKALQFVRMGKNSNFS